MSYALSLLRVAVLHVAGVAVWFAFCLSQPAFAAPDDIVRICAVGELVHGVSGDGDCSYYEEITVADLTDDDFIRAVTPDWSYAWFRVGDCVGSELIWLPYGSESFLEFSALGYEGGGGGPDPDPDPPGEEFGLDDLDMEEVLRAFSAGFFLVAVFWGFGKGVALILQQVRRG